MIKRNLKKFLFDGSELRWDRAIIAVLALLCVVILLLKLFGFYSNSSKEVKTSVKRPEVTENGLHIKFDENSPSLELIKTLNIKSEEATTHIFAPARVVISIIGGEKSSGSILFESSEITSLYSQYRQSKVSLDRTGSNLSRAKDMFRNQLATAKELNDAEGEFLSAQAIYNEFDVKLRAEGFNPFDLSGLKSGTSIIIADIPESQLRETQTGEEVKIELSSFPGKSFLGKVTAIGDIVDPVTRTVKVRVTLNSTHNVIRPGMFGKVDFGTSQHSVAIPTASIVTVEEQSYVFVALSKNEFDRRSITIVSNDSNDAIVLSGLSENESVVTSGAMLLKGLSFGY